MPPSLLFVQVFIIAALHWLLIATTCQRLVSLHWFAAVSAVGILSELNFCKRFSNHMSELYNFDVLYFIITLRNVLNNFEQSQPIAEQKLVHD